MAHQVESMFSVKETPWHGLGEVVEGINNIAEGIIKAGLNWTVEVETPQVTGFAADALQDYARVFVRVNADGTRKILAMNGPKTYPLQNESAFNFFQPALDQNLASLETAGSLDEGRKVWVLAKLNKPNMEVSKGDEIAKFVMLSNSFDGTLAVRVGFTPIRIVCANTLASAHMNKASKLIRVRHSKDVHKNVEMLQTAINYANESFEATLEQYRAMQRKNINKNDVEKYVEKVFAFKRDAETDKLPTRSQNILDSIVQSFEDKYAIGAQLIASFKQQQEQQNEMQAKTGKEVLESIVKNLETGKGHDLSGGTVWGMYNSANEYLNYERGHNNDTRMKSLWFGDNNVTNEFAFQTALEMTKA